MSEPAVSAVPDANSSVIYMASDQPEACRWCGARTIFTEFSDSLQQHDCPSCEARYLVEFE
jgi:hypothetical protein